MKPLVSVIVPVYRAEKYIEGCVRSLQAQSYDQLEIILIDDGSPDESPAICDAFALLDDRIRVVHKKNGGASSARNCGLDLAKGKYIVFVDSDDIVPPNGIEALARNIDDNGCDYVAGMCEIDSTGKVKQHISEVCDIDFQKDPEALLAYITKSGSYSPYAKIFRREIIEANHIRYDTDLKCSEDALFIRMYFKHCKRLRLIPAIVYQYTTVNEMSLSKKGYPEYVRYYAKKMGALESLMEVLPLSDNEKLVFLHSRAIHGVQISMEHYFSRFPKSEWRRFADLIRSELSPWISSGRKLKGKGGAWYRFYQLECCVDNEVKMYKALRCAYSVL